MNFVENKSSELLEGFGGRFGKLSELSGGSELNIFLTLLRNILDLLGSVIKFLRDS